MRRRLGRSALEVTPIGLGCWQFAAGKGLASFWGHITQQEIDDIVAAALQGGINWFDTAEIYGRGRSERGLASALEHAGKQNSEVVIASKWWPTLRPAAHILRSIDERLACLAPFGIDLYQVHWPWSRSSIAAQMEAMAQLCAAHKIRAVGVSNFSARQMRVAHAALTARGLVLASNQVRYNLLDRKIERNGVYQTAVELGIAIIAYSPLAQGILTGKFHDNPNLASRRAGPRRFFGAFRRRGLDRSRMLVSELKAVAAAHGATPSQVALAWLIDHHEGVFAIPGASRREQVADHISALSLRLSSVERTHLDELSR